MTRSALLLFGLVACTQETKVEPLDDETEVTGEQPASEDDSGEVDTAGQGTSEEETEEDVADSGEAEDDLPSDYIYEDDEVEALLSPEQVQQGITDGIVAMLSVDPDLMHDTYNTIIDESRSAALAGEADCPYYYEDYYTYYGYYYWYDSCTAEDDLTYSGYGYSYDYEPYETSGYRYSDVSYLYGNLALTTPEGATFEGSGYSYHQEYGYSTNYYAVYAYVYGNWAYDGEDAEGNWLTQNLGVNTYVSASAYSDMGVPYSQMTMTGSVSGLSGDVNTIVMTDTFIYTEAYGSDCDLEPSGLISVRDSQGEWYDVEFQGPPYMGASVFPTDCDGCGQIWFRGEYLGEACPDFSRMTDWEVRPW